MMNITNVNFITSDMHIFVQVTTPSKVWKKNASEMLLVTELFIILVMVTLPPDTLPCTSLCPQTHSSRPTLTTHPLSAQTTHALNITLATHYDTSNIWLEMEANYYKIQIWNSDTELNKGKWRPLIFTIPRHYDSVRPARQYLDAPGGAEDEKTHLLWYSLCVVTTAFDSGPAEHQPSGLHQ